MVLIDPNEVDDHAVKIDVGFFSQIIEGVKNFWLVSNSVTTLALLHEFYLGTCQLKTRKSVVRSLLRKSGLLSLVLLVLMLLERIPLVLFDPKLEKLTGNLIDLVSPALVVAMVCLTGSSVYFGVRILLALSRGQRMSEDSNQSVRKYATLYRLVVVAIVFSGLKFLMLLIRVPFNVFLSTSIHSCMEKAEMGQETMSCQERLSQQAALSTHLTRDTLLGLVELILINGIMILKKRRNVDG